MQARPSSVGAVLGSIVLGCLALVFGGLGACFVLIGGISVMESSPGVELFQFLGIGIISVALTIGCIMGIVRLNRRR